MKNPGKSLERAFAAVILVLPLLGCAGSVPCPSPLYSAAHSDVAGRVGSGYPAQRHREPSSGDSSLGAAKPEEGAADDDAAGDMPSGNLLLLAGHRHATRAVILVAGIHDSYHYFDSWVALLAAPGTAIWGWKHDHRSTTMESAAAILAQDLADLRKSGVTEITLVAHSIGGLVAKGAIDRFAGSGTASPFKRLDLHALGTPWGGFALLEAALEVPGSIAISRYFGYPMASELRPSSRYLSSLAAPMPAYGQLHLYVGEADSVALPVADSAKRRYAALESAAATVTTISGLRHNDYNRAIALAIGMKNMHVDHACHGGPCRSRAEIAGCAADAPAVARAPSAH